MKPVWFQLYTLTTALCTGVLAFLSQWDAADAELTDLTAEKPELAMFPSL